MKHSVSSQGILEHARHLGATALRRPLAWLAARTALRLGFLAAAATLVGRLVMDGGAAAWLAAAAALLLVLTVAAGLGADRALADAETAVAAALRDEAGRRLKAMETRALQAVPVGSLVVALQRHPEALAALVVGHRAAAIMMAAGPLMAAGALMLVSWQAALAVLGLTPLMIVFFVLLGDTIRRRADAQERAFGRLAGQFADRIRTLPTILANHALAREEDKLSARLRAYAGNTMGVLRVAFLNAGVIDFFASLSIAMLAVFLGLGHLGLARIPGFSGLELWQSLFILMIAPDYFAPVRRYAEQYHAKAEGQAAAAALDALLTPQAVTAPPAIAGIDALPPRGLVAITGPSGAGKTTLLRRLAGVDGGRAAFPGSSFPGLSWVSTDSFVPQGSLAGALAWNAGEADRARLEDAARRVGLADDRFLPGGLDAPVAAGGANLSGGQRLRLAVARALVSGRPVVADEPTAKLDGASARMVRQALRNIAADRLVVVATHDPALAALADRRIDLAGAPQGKPA